MSLKATGYPGDREDQRNDNPKTGWTVGDRSFGWEEASGAAFRRSDFAGFSFLPCVSLPLTVSGGMTGPQVLERRQWAAWQPPAGSRAIVLRRNFSGS